MPLYVPTVESQDTRLKIVLRKMAIRPIGKIEEFVSYVISQAISPKIVQIRTRIRIKEKVKKMMQKMKLTDYLLVPLV